ncbi:MAG: hypothetical protein WKF87_07625 [Chryseolinea sp.]
MKEAEVKYRLQRTTQKYLVLRLIAAVLWCLCVIVTCLAVGQLLSLPIKISWFTALSLSAAFLVFQSIRTKIFSITQGQMMSFINRQYPELEESTDLLLSEDHLLTSLQRLQKEKSSKRFELLYPTLRLPVRLVWPLAMLAATVVIAAILLYFFRTRTADISAFHVLAKKESPVSAAVSGLKNIKVVTLPPRYTGLQSKEQEHFNLNIPEGTIVAWEISFTGKINDPKLIFNGKDTLEMGPSGKYQFKAKSTFFTSGFYQLTWRNTHGKRKFSDYFQITVSPDAPADIKVMELDQFTELSAEDPHTINLKTILTDDYALRDAYIIATVSKGSGESVKFREEKLRFTQPEKFGGKLISAQRPLDLISLGLEPGDELYFYVEALDSRLPHANKSRTETYFISLKDTSVMTTSLDAGLGVDLMPEYFRSQRQIIIDSEKLLKQKKSLVREKFNARSNELGHDQKVLRLRYGEFLGEEFESSIGPVAGVEEHHENEDITKVYGHQHDTEMEHDAVEQPAGRTQEKSDSETDPSKAYAHAHDSEEEATFFTQSIRSKLKAAVTIMWDAELHLRLNDPQKSLPFQYRALKLLKEISQDSRIYVHRTGFDPPPLKEEKRLSGDLSELRNATAKDYKTTNERFQGVRKALAYLANTNLTRVPLSPEAKSIFIRAGKELSSIAIAQPGRYLKTLSIIKAFSEGEISQADRLDAIDKISAAFYSVLPVESYSPRAENELLHLMDEKFIESIDAQPSGKRK